MKLSKFESGSCKPDRVSLSDGDRLSEFSTMRRSRIEGDGATQRRRIAHRPDMIVDALVEYDLESDLYRTPETTVLVVDEDALLDEETVYER